MERKQLLRLLVLLPLTLYARLGAAQVTVAEAFTGATTTNSWYYFGGACLTASSASSVSNPGVLPGCTAVRAASYNGENLVGGQNGVSGSAQTLPDPVGSGALRFTNGYPYGNNEGGAIISANNFSSSAGVLITFKTVTYRGDSGGSNSDGADGISFFLMDGAVTPTSTGSEGGSLAYTCSNPGNIGGHPIIDGLIGGYLGLGIDEYGNFLNQGDNTNAGYGAQGNRIGMRGAGSVAWSVLNASYPSYYPSALTASQRQSAVAKTCQTGYLWDYSTPASPVAVTTGGSSVSGSFGGKVTRRSNTITNIPLPLPASLTVGATVTDPSGYIPGGTTITAIGTNSVTMSNNASSSASSSGTAETFTYTSTTPGQNTYILDYPPIPNAYTVLSGVKIANESAMSRGAATPIFYRLKLSSDGYLSLSYSISGAAYQSIISNQLITTSNGPLPANFRFGFSGSTGGSTNIHEILCFQAQPSDTSGSSTSVNEKQAAKVEAGTQAYFAYYDPNDWTGALTANNLVDTAGVITISPTANWDAACNLTGVASGKTCGNTGASGPIAAAAPSSRVMLTWNGTAGAAFEWANITSTQQNTLDAGDSTPYTSDRLLFLRGDRTNEVNSSGVGEFRSRNGVLGDIVDSSPTWVGPPSAPYTSTWSDKIIGGSAPENSGQTYLAYTSANQTRLNVVYGGANDGFLHGFRAGSFSAGGAFVNNSTTPNDGQEVLAYMPAAVVNAIHNSTTAALDYANVNYGHAFYVDATPGTGDLYYNGTWHTWLVGGLGAGGAAIYALDISNPSNFSEANASSLVIGEWSPSTISCTNVTSCGNNLGNTYGTPLIRRFHNGQWGVIFGNGFGSTSGDAGIYIMLVSSTGTTSTYYLSTGSASSNGIGATTAADLDGDHVTDYIYAGDLNGNLWRFDVTSSNPASWSAGSAPIFTAPSGEPVTTAPVVASVPVTSGSPRLMISFGTGRVFPLTNSTPTSYATGQQYIYGIWDWNMSGWNGKSTTTYASLAASGTATGLSSPYTISQSNLAYQTLTVDATTGVRYGSTSTICWQGSCASGSGKFGWYVNLPTGQEQIIYNPVLYQGAVIVDSKIPAANSPTSCNQSADTGYTYILSIATGTAFTTAFTKYNTLSNVVGIQTNATGTPAIVTTAEATTSLVYQTVSGTPSAQQITLPSNLSMKRLNWVQLR